MTLRMYSPCDVCDTEVENDMIFHRRLPDTSGWLQYSLCDKHLPILEPRTHIWKHQWRIGRQLATLLGLGIGLGGCYKCGTPWDCVRSHTTPFAHYSGCFALCEKCWQELTPQQRLPYYEKLMAQWGDAKTLPEVELIRTAVLEGK